MRLIASKLFLSSRAMDRFSVQFSSARQELIVNRTCIFLSKSIGTNSCFSTRTRIRLCSWLEFQIYPKASQQTAVFLLVHVHVFCSWLEFQKTTSPTVYKSQNTSLFALYQVLLFHGARCQLSSTATHPSVKSQNMSSSFDVV